MNTPPERLPGFQRQQLAFTAHIRDPRNSPPPQGIPAARMAVYSELLFNGIEGLLSGNFPVLREIVPDTEWKALVRDFYARHRCQRPLFTEIALEFLDYLQHERTPAETDRPFLLELAHYEYAELAIGIMDTDTDRPGHDPDGDLLHARPILSRAVWNLSYRFPVHRIGPGYLPEAPGKDPTRLLVYRDREDEVHFLEINPVTQRLVALMQENVGSTGLEILRQIAEELGHINPDSVIAAGKQLLEDLHRRGVVLGSC
jgi:hypothetical protein